jgi:hypothetical protein
MLAKNANKTPTAKNNKKNISNNFGMDVKKTEFYADFISVGKAIKTAKKVRSMLCYVLFTFQN